MNLKSSAEYNITGRGKVFLINLQENNLPLYRKEFFDILFDKDVQINGATYHTKGIEARGIPMSSEHSEIGLLV